MVGLVGPQIDVRLTFAGVGLLLQGLDIFSTALFLDQGFPEGNPIVAWLWTASWPALLALKVALGACLYWVVKAFPVAAWVGVGIMAVVPVFNSVGLLTS